MKKFTVPCQFGAKKAPFDVYIGQPAEDLHPLYFQAMWLKEERGGIVPEEVMDSFAKLLALSEKNNVPFEDLCVYALEAANEGKKPEELTEEERKAQKLLAPDFQVLIGPEGMRKHFDDDFCLVFIRCKDTSGSMNQIVMVIRAEYLDVLRTGILQNEMTRENCLGYGKPEYLIRGADINNEVMEKLIQQFQ